MQCAPGQFSALTKRNQPPFRVAVGPVGRTARVVEHRAAADPMSVVGDRDQDILGTLQNPEDNPGHLVPMADGVDCFLHQPLNSRFCDIVEAGGQIDFQLGPDSGISFEVLEVLAQRSFQPENVKC